MPPTRKSRPWENIQFTDEQLRYDPDEWLVPAQDSKGHSAREMVRMPPGMEYDIERIIEAKKFPYRTKSDLLRHAVYRHIRWLQQLEPDVPVHFLLALQFMQGVATEDTYHAEVDRTFHELDTRIQDALNRGDQVQAIKMIARAKMFLDRAEDTNHKRRMKEMFRERYGHFLNGSAEDVAVGVDRQITGQVSVDVGMGERGVIDAEFVDEEDD